ncbi:MAG: hypothetical protein KJI72_03865 [Patescibacteria group bacterium]|nr:hypothetical protein [Patescibacteria group bacterium]
MKKIKKNKYFKFIEMLYSMAKDARWKMFYDKESDSLYWTKRPFPADDKLAKVAREISFFLDRRGNVNGLMIQPFQNNFLSHNEEVTNIGRLFTSKKDDSIFTIPVEKRKEAEPLLNALTATIKKDIYRDAIEANYSLEDLADFLSVSVK